jgi:hypothetical protein
MGSLQAFWRDHGNGLTAEKADSGEIEEKQGG